VASALAARSCLLPSSASRAASSSARAWARVSSSDSSCSASWPMVVVSSWASMPSCQRELERCREQDGPAAW